MSGNIEQIAELIVARRQQLDQIMRSDLIKLQVAHGDSTLTEAIRLADKIIDRDRLSIQGERKRHGDKRQHAQAAQQAFREKG